LFERLREAEARRVPDFTRVLDRAPRRLRLAFAPPRLRRAALGLALIALTASAGWWFTHPITSPRTIADADLAILHWRPPTEALLGPQKEDDRQPPPQPTTAVGGQEGSEMR
jgi:hypothetical protein